jgi:hypothetical protein
MLYKIKTPVFIDLNNELNNLSSNEFNLNQEDPLDIYIDPLTITPPPTPPINTTLPFILAPRYYLLIKSPLDQNLPTLKIKIHKSSNSLLKNKARILLDPSISYGLNSCYTVEYWEWVPNLNLPAEISKRKLKTEKWYIPTLNSNYIPEYPYRMHYNEYSNINIFNDTFYLFTELNKPRLISEKIEVVRTINTVDNLIEDLISNPKYCHIFSFARDSVVSFTENIITEDLNFNQETKSWNFSKALINSLLIRKNENIDGAIVNGLTITTINYIKPFASYQLNIEDNYNY